MAGALWLARQLERPLIVDWRGQAQLRDKSLNYFTEFFESPSKILGVPILYAPADVGDYVQGSRVSEWIEPERAARLASGVETTGAPLIVCQTFHGLERLPPGPESERFRFLRSFYRAIRPAPRIKDAANSWWSENCDGAFVVGVNVRTGNGQYYGKGMPYAGRVDISLFDDDERFLRKIEDACRARTRALPRQIRDDFVVFHATDSPAMSELLSRLPAACSRRTVYPPPGTGDLHSFEDEHDRDRGSVIDTVVDMFLLARCDALVYNSSVFNQYARVSTGYFGGNLVHIESLFLRKNLARNVAAIRRRVL
jgi:Nodulation protein Z (NodZ)